MIAPNAKSVRQHERVKCAFRAELTVVPLPSSAALPGVPFAATVRLSRSALAGNGSVVAQLIDCSVAGLGVKLPVYLPVGCGLLIKTFDEGGGVLIEAIVKVMRSEMLDCVPNYYCGTNVVEVAIGSTENLISLARKIEAVAAVSPTDPLYVDGASNTGVTPRG